MRPTLPAADISRTLSREHDHRGKQYSVKIAVIGTGYVGLVTGVVLASLGHTVTCVDTDQDKLDTILAGKSPIYEPGLAEMIRQCLHDGRLLVSSSTEAATRANEIVFIAVGTPQGADGSTDLTYVRQVVTEIAKGVEDYTVVVNKSTVPVGSADVIARMFTDLGVAPGLFDLVSNPEFLREGTAIRDTLSPDRIVIGSSSPRAIGIMKELYAAIDRPILVTDVKTAELIKHASNSFLAMKISFINALACLCEECGADIGDVARGIGADSRIGPQFLNAGLGWGGSCFPKDVLGLLASATAHGVELSLLREVVEINDEMPRRLVRRISQRLGGLEGKTIGLLGLAFKANTDDIREARSLKLVEAILTAGGAVRTYDPAAMEKVSRIHPAIHCASSAYEAAKAADAVIVVTEWDEFKGIDLSRLAAAMRQPILFDGRRLYDAERAKSAGLEYHTIGSAWTGSSNAYTEFDGSLKVVG